MNAQNEQIATPERRLVSEAEAAKLLAISARTLQQLRLDGGGPPYVQITSRRIGYEIADLPIWWEERKRRSTSDKGSEA